MTMNILGIDSSGTVASAAVLSGRRVKALFSTDTTFTHSTSLMPLIDRAVTSAGMEIKDIGLIAVSAGPGSFTGLRIGAGSAKGIALGVKCGIVAVPTLKSLAYRIPFADGIICPIMDARRGRVYTASYIWEYPYTGTEEICTVSGRTDTESRKSGIVSAGTDTGSRKSGVFLNGTDTGSRKSGIVSAGTDTGSRKSGVFLNGTDTESREAGAVSERKDKEFRENGKAPGGEVLKNILPEEAADIRELFQKLYKFRKRVIFTGDAADSMRDIIEKEFRHPYAFPPDSVLRQSAAAVAELGREMYEEGCSSDIHDLKLHYMVRSSAKTISEREKEK